MSARTNLKDYREEELRHGTAHIQVDIDELLADYKHEYRSRLSQLFEISRELIRVVSYYAVINKVSHDKVRLYKWQGTDRMTRNFMRGYLLKLNGVYVWESIFFDERDPKWTDEWVDELIPKSNEAES